LELVLNGMLFFFSLNFEDHVIDIMRLKG